uniref:GRAM domain containing 1B n=1 Tax=Sander lucioperca TaxID=283035 RepID=A0A8C9YSY0_SANLU
QPAADMSDALRPPSLQVNGGANTVSDGSVRSSFSTPTLRRKRFKMRRMRNVPSERELERGRLTSGHLTARSGSKEYLQLPSIEITPSSDEDATSSWSRCSTPSASPRRKRFLLRKWLKVRQKKEQGSESSSQQSSQQSSHEDDNTRFLTPFIREESTASNSNKSTPACSPVLRKRSRSPTPQSQEGENMVEKGSDHSSDKSPSTPEQVVQRTYSLQSARSGGKNSKKSQSWYNVLSPTYKQRNEDFRKLFKQLPDTERLIVDYSCALQRDILLQGRLYLSENWICFYSNIFRWETLLTVRLKDICSMTKEKTARLIPNAIQVCTDTEKDCCSCSSYPQFDLPAEEYADCLPDGELLALPLLLEENNDTSGPGGLVPSPSLDFNDNEDIPTELSDSSETHDEGEVQAFHEDLNGRQYINEIYKLSVDKLYAILFTESQFMSDFMEQRRFSEVVYHPWKTEEAGNQTREILYTISLSNPLAPKTATVTETQTLYKASQESECYIIDAEVITHDVPYHDYFYTLNRYMLTRVAKNKCRLRVSTELRYRKQPWGLVKGFIEKNFWSGLAENFRHLELELAKLEEILESHQLSPKVIKNSTVRRKKRPLPHMRSQHMDEALSPVTTPTDEEVIQRIKQVAGSTQTRHQSPEHHHLPAGLALYSVSKLLLIISFVLVLLVFLNMMLFYKLWMLEYSAQSLTTWQGLRLHESKLPQTQMEWAQLLEAQQRYHDVELQKWREIIKSSVVLLDQMKDSLLNLQRGIGLSDYSSEAEEKRSRYH